MKQVGHHQYLTKFQHYNHYNVITILQEGPYIIQGCLLGLILTHVDIKKVTNCIQDKTRESKVKSAISKANVAYFQNKVKSAISKVSCH